MNSDIRIGKVSEVNYDTGMLRVTYTDKGKATTAEMPFANYNDEYNMPKVGSSVIVAHLSNGSSRGVVLGTVWNRKNKPTESGESLYRKDLSKTKGAAMYRYDDDTGEYLLKAPNIEINGVNKTTVDGPRVVIDASISITLETQQYGISAKKATVAIPEVTLGEAPEEGEPASEMKITNHCDIAFLSEENILEATVKSMVLKALEEITIETEKKLSATATEGIEVKTDTQMVLEDAGWKTTLSNIMNRLAALDGNQSDRK